MLKKACVLNTVQGAKRSQNRERSAIYNWCKVRKNIKIAHTFAHNLILEMLFKLC
jgi:hypothetical protein